MMRASRARFCFTPGGHNALVGLPISLILIAVGAVLAFAVHHDPNAAVNVHVVGWILMGVGLIGLLLALLWWERWGPGYWGARRTSYAGPPGDGYARRPYAGRRTVVEEREGPAPPPSADPYDAPPPP
jgi:uncharacterized membrane protein